MTTREVSAFTAQDLADFQDLFKGVENSAMPNDWRGPHRMRGRVVGSHLDNACGDDIRLEAIQEGYQEFVLIIDVFETVVDLPHRGTFNMANLLAIIRARAPRIRRELPHHHSILARIEHITRGCRPDMHEPDEQGLSMQVMYPEFDSDRPWPEHSIPTTLVLQRERTEGPHDEMEFFPLSSLIQMLLVS